MKTDDGRYFAVADDVTTSGKKFIEKGGFNAVIQLNVGLPL